MALIVGDLNCAVGNGKLGVEGNTARVSYGGELIRDLINTGDYVLLNSLSIAKGGPWTRVCPGAGGPSCLDLAIASRELVPHVTAVQVDSGRLYTPRRAVSKKGKLGVTYSNHFPVLVDLKMPRAGPPDKLPAKWNLNKPGGWKLYEEESDRIAEKLEEVIEYEGYDSDELMQKVDKLDNKMKFKAFGKTYN